MQSVATRIIVQRERERMAFRSAAYWDVLAELDASVSDPQRHPAAVHRQAGQPSTASGWPPDATSTRWARSRKPDEVLVLDEAGAGALAAGLRGAPA